MTKFIMHKGRWNGKTFAHKMIANLYRALGYTVKEITPNALRKKT